MLELLPHFLWLGVIATTLDVDNALYMTSQTQNRPEKEQRRLIFWGLAAEFGARLVLLLIAFYLASGKEVLFAVYGLEITAQVIALLGAGLFLFLSSAGELNDYLTGTTETEAKVPAQHAPFIHVLAQMTIVNAVLSIDTVIAVAGMTDKIIGAMIILSVSAGIRFLFVRQIAGLIARLPETKVVVLTFLTLIGLQLVLQAVHDDLPESGFNIVMALAVCAAIALRWKHRSKLGVQQASASPVTQAGKPVR